MIPTTIVIGLLLGCWLVARSDARPRPRHSAGYLMAAQLNVKLAGTAMRGTGFALVTEGKRAGVNPALIAGIAGKESSYGAAVCEPFNAWGLGSCGRAWHPPRFTSWRQAIRYMAYDYLRVRYLGRVRDVYGMARSYCPGCPTWARDVARNVRALGFEPTLRYPR